MYAKIKKRFSQVDRWLVVILILATFLYGWNIWEAGSANDFTRQLSLACPKVGITFGMLALIRLGLSPSTNPR